MGLHRLSIACLLTSLLLCATPSQVSGSSKDKVPIKSLDVITLQSGQMTTGRRSSPVPQLTYRGSRSLERYTPSSVQCYNRGHDGYEVQWECVADLPVEVRLVKINVDCEGYENPDDPNILKGSCGLEYTLELTGAGKSRSDHHYADTGSQSVTGESGEGWATFFWSNIYTVPQNYLHLSSPYGYACIIGGIVIIVIYRRYFTVIPSNTATNSHSHGNSSNMNFGNTNIKSDGNTSNLNIANGLFGNGNQNDNDGHDRGYGGGGGGSGQSCSGGGKSTSLAGSGTTERATGFRGAARRDT